MGRSGRLLQELHDGIAPVLELFPYTPCQLAEQQTGTLQKAMLRTRAVYDRPTRTLPLCMYQTNMPAMPAVWQHDMKPQMRAENARREMVPWRVGAMEPLHRCSESAGVFDTRMERGRERTRLRC